MVATPALTVRGLRNSSLASSDKRTRSATRLRPLGVGLRQEHDELLAPVPGDRVQPAGHGVGQVGGDPPQGLVARAVAVRVVVGLEMVDVEKHQGEAAAESPDPLRLALQLPLEEAPVVEPGELVGEGQGTDLGLQPDALEGHRELAGDGRAGGEARGLEGEEAQRAVLPHEGKEGQATRLLSPRQVVAPDEARRDTVPFRGPGAVRGEREHARPRDRVLVLGLVQREAHGLHAERRGVLGEEREDLSLVLCGLQRHGEGADQVHLAGVVEAASRVLAVGALAEGNAGQVEQVFRGVEGPTRKGGREPSVAAQ